MTKGLTILTFSFLIFLNIVGTYLAASSASNTLYKHASFNVIDAQNNLPAQVDRQHYLGPILL